MSAPAHNATADAALGVLADASCHLIPSFFLGGLFLSALICMVSPSFVTYFLTRFRGSRPDSISEKTRSLYTSSTSSSTSDENHTLFFLLSFFFASASLAHFASLPTFPVDSKVACAFVIAWAGVATQAACLIGLLILFLDLRRLGIHRAEIIFYLLWLVLAAASVLVTNILGTGKIQPIRVPEFAKLAFCKKNRVFVASVISSMLYILIELYTLFRLWTLLSPPFLSSKHRYATLTDARILRAVSLLTLELLVIYPSAVNTNVFAEFLPFSIGALLVLAAFSMEVKLPEGDIKPDSIPPSRYPSMAPPPVVPTQYTTTEMPSQWRESKQSTGYQFDNDIRHSMAETGELSPLPMPTMRYHPFSAQSLGDPTMQREWPAPTRTARSSRTIDTAAAKSIRNAIIQTAKRAASSFDRRSSSITEDSEVRSTTTTTAPPTASSPSFHALPRSLARPRLVVLTSNNGKSLRRGEGEVPPDSSVLRPVMQGPNVVRLTPTFVSPTTAQYPSSTNELGLRFSLKGLPRIPRDSVSSTSMMVSPTTRTFSTEGPSMESLSEEGYQRESTYTFGGQQQQRLSAIA